jgi:hypothetical protein
MKTFSGREFQTYEVSGTDVRVHWDIQETQREDLEGVSTTQWEAEEAVCGVSDSRSELIEKIIAAKYTVQKELATINNKDVDPESYQAYQAFRAEAKALADGWIAVRSA